jgi:hypothetical protein
VKRISALGSYLILGPLSEPWRCREGNVSPGICRGDVNGITPTGKPFNISGVTIARLANGKMAESYVNWDALGFMQLGVGPELAKAKAAAK